MVLLGDEAQVVARVGPFGDSVILTQDRCMVYAERIICLEVVLDTPDRIPRLHESIWNLILVYLVILLVSVQDRCTVCTKHTIGSEIILDAPDGTPSL